MLHPQGMDRLNPNGSHYPRVCQCACGQNYISSSEESKLSSSAESKKGDSDDNGWGTICHEICCKTTRLRDDISSRAT
jgi:hypothetical protein